MKNNPWNKIFIESDGLHDLYQEFGWLIKVRLFFKKKLIFFSILSFNIELNRESTFCFFLRLSPQLLHVDAE
jgi:hypothetical protein